MAPMMTLGRWALGALLVVSPAVASAGPAKSKNTGQLLKQADAHRKKGEHREAGDAYGRYYASQTVQERATAAGAFVIDFAVKSYRAAYEASNDEAHLAAARDLLRRFLADVDAVHGAESTPAFAADAQTQLAELEAELEPAGDAEAPEPEPPAEPPDEPDPDQEQEQESEPELDPEPIPRLDVQPTRDEPVVDTAPPAAGPDRVGIGLLVGGSVAVLGGVGMLIAGSQYQRIGRDRVATAEAEQPDTVKVDRDPYLETVRRNGNVMMGVGGAVIAVGLVPTIWGAVRLARHREGKNVALVVAPRFLGVRGRF